MGFPFGFSSLEDAQGFRRLSSDDSVIVVGIGLHDSLVASFKSQLEEEGMFVILTVVERLVGNAEKL